MIGNAIKVARIATGEIVEDITDDSEDAAAVSLGKRGGVRSQFENNVGLTRPRRRPDA